MKLALVKWNDAHFLSAESVKKEDLVDDMILYSAGILVEDDGGAIKVALDYSPESQDYREVQVIPKEYILEYVTLDIEVAKAKPKRRRKAKTLDKAKES